jgi:hypothetical protein
MFRDTVELLEATLGEGPEALDTIDVIRAGSELVRAVVDTKMLQVTDIDETVVASPFVAVNDGLKCHMAFNYGLQSASRDIRDYLGIDEAVAFEDAENDRLATCPAASFPANTPGPKVALVNFDNSAKWGCPLAFFGYSSSDFQIDLVDRPAGQTDNFSRFAGHQIKGKIPYDLTSFSFINFGTSIITV